MENKICFFKKTVLFITLLFLSVYTFSEEQNKFEQKLEWVYDPNVYEYKIEIRDFQNKKVVKKFQTEKNYVIFSMPSGKYQYRIFAFDFLGRESDKTNWIDFEILKAVEPKIRDNNSLSELITEKNETIEIKLQAENISEKASVTLTNPETKESVYGVVQKIEKENGTVVLEFPKQNTISDEWKIIVTNPGGLSDSLEISKEKIEAERLETERLAKEEAERLETERLAKEEAERLEAERLAKEEAERLEAERLAKEEAERLEAERLAKEEAERLEAERLAKEEAERLEAERLAIKEKKAEEKRQAAEAKKAAKIEAKEKKAEEKRIEAEKKAEEKRLEKEQKAVANRKNVRERKPANFTLQAGLNFLQKPLYVAEYTGYSTTELLGPFDFEGRINYLPVKLKKTLMGLEFEFSHVQFSDKQEDVYDLELSIFTLMQINYVTQFSLYKDKLYLGLRAGGGLSSIYKTIKYQTDKRNGSLFLQPAVDGAISLVYNPFKFMNLELGFEYDHIFDRTLPLGYCKFFTLLGLRF